MELKQFIQKVRDELKSAYDERPSTPILALSAVELEVSFTLSGTGGAKGKLLVVDLEGEVSSARTHKVILHLKPTAPSTDGQIAFPLDKDGLLPLAAVDRDRRGGPIL